jgi:hypothetical protein
LAVLQTFGPPLAALVVAIGLRWVIAGFAKRNSAAS